MKINFKIDDDQELSNIISTLTNLKDDLKNYGDELRYIIRYLIDLQDAPIHDNIEKYLKENAPVILNSANKIVDFW